MIKLAKIANLITYFIITYVFFSTVDETNSLPGRFYYFEKPQFNDCENVLYNIPQFKFNFNAYLSREIPRLIQNFDISDTIRNKVPGVFEKLVFQNRYRDDIVANTLPIFIKNHRQKIITKESQDIPHLIYS